jgi:carbonic anhydrase
LTPFLLVLLAKPGSVPPPDARQTAAAPASAVADPIEALRLRLAERLSAGPGADPQSAEVRVTPRAAAVPQVAAPARERSAGARAAAAPAKPAAAPWSYAGPTGPSAWASLKPEYSLCASGPRQSPIDLHAGLPVDLEPVQFHYKPSRFSVIDTGRTVQVNVGPGNHIDVGGRKFELVQFQFHRPAEHKIDGRQFEMSVHLLHKDAQGRLAVVAVLLGEGPAQPVVQTVWNNLPLEKHEERAARVELDPAGLLPTDRRYYTYMGSLTAPPCTEGVQWVIMRSPVTVAAAQVELFSRIYPMNARPLQQAAGRRILQSQ